MNIKKKLLDLYYFGNSSREKINQYQQVIRDVEWEAVSEFIPLNASFLDIGCGAGYSMVKAKMDRNCEVSGIDPNPYEHGVNRVWGKSSSAEVSSSLNIIQGDGEKLPYDDEQFDVVYSSHVLEHVNSESQFLSEAKRVLKPEGVLILGVPTAEMAWLNLISNILFTSHQRLFNFVFGKTTLFTVGKTPLKHVFLPPSHSFAERTIFYDLKHYRVSNWRKIVGSVFRIQEELLPAFYPYPDFLQLFRLKKNWRAGSSVFFVCSK